MKKVIHFLLGLVILWAHISGSVIAEDTMDLSETPDELQQLYAQSAVLMDADSGRILFEKNGHEKRPMASTTKIMTCILALEMCELEETVTISRNASIQPKVRLGIQEGQRFLLRDLLYSLMLESHNDVAVAIAEHISGNVESFAKIMNRKAKDIGLLNTHFITPNGLDGEDEEGIHATTASDLALLMKYCILDSSKREMFLEITGCTEYSFSDINKTNRYHCMNHNAFLRMMEGAISGKTGFTSKAGYCYVGALKDGDCCFIVSLLGCGWPNHKDYKWLDTKKLMKYGLENYTYENIWKESSIKQISLNNGVMKYSSIFEKVYVPIQESSEETEYKFLLSDKDEVLIHDTVYEDLSAPLMKGKEVGRRSFRINDKVVLEIPLVTSVEIYLKDYEWILKKILELYMLKNIN